MFEGNSRLKVTMLSPGRQASPLATVERRIRGVAHESDLLGPGAEKSCE